MTGPIKILVVRWTSWFWISKWEQHLCRGRQQERFLSHHVKLLTPSFLLFWKCCRTNFNQPFGNKDTIKFLAINHALASWESSTTQTPDILTFPPFLIVHGPSTWPSPPHTLMGSLCQIIPFLHFWTDLRALQHASAVSPTCTDLCWGAMTCRMSWAHGGCLCFERLLHHKSKCAFSRSLLMVSMCFEHVLIYCFLICKSSCYQRHRFPDIEISLM